MDLARRYAMPVLLIGLFLAFWLGWAMWTRNSLMFTVTEGAVGKEHAERRCAKQGMAPEVVNDARPGQVSYRCVKPSA